MSDQIDVNQLSNALQQKIDLPPGKSQAEIDYVVDWQTPTVANNYSWYRLYKSGWIEQGGLLGTNLSSQTIYLLKEMQNTYYSIQLSIGNFSGTGTTGYDRTHGWGQRTVSSFHVDSAAESNVTGQWEVKGFAAIT